MLLVTTALTGLLAGTIQTAPAPPQTPPQNPGQTPPPATSPAAADEDAFELDEVAVSGTRLRGSVDTDIPPDLVLSAEEIQAYGASNIAELMTYLEPVTRSSSGRTDLPPVFLVNGRRISGFQEIQGIPTEAIERTEVLPEAVAVEFGYRPEQRVVNFVLKPDFRSLTGEVEARLPFQGGRTVGSVESNILNIAGSRRWSMDIDLERTTPLFESERDIVRDPDSAPYDTAEEIGAYRNLLAETARNTVRGTMKRDLNGTTQLTLSGSLEDTSSRSFNGLPSVILNLDETNPYATAPDNVLFTRYLDGAEALQRRTDGLNAKLGMVMDGFLGEEWRWTLSANYDRSETDTETGRGYAATPFQARLDANDPTADPFGALAPADFTPIAADTANSVSQTLGAELVLNGDLYELPAGDLSSTFRLGADTRSLDSTSTRLGVTTERDQTRDRVTGQANFTLPIASRRNEVLAGIGDLSLSLNMGFEELSDFGGLSTFGFTVNWSPLEKLSVLASYTDEEGAPSIGQLNDPILSTPNVPVFDFSTGQTVLVTQVTGGNPGLDADNRKVGRFGLTFRPFGQDRDLSLQSTWTWSRTDDYIASFPAVTPDLEAALPGRFTRDLAGNLVSVDARPLNFERFERQDIRTGFSYSQAFGAPNPQAAPLPGQPGSARPPVPGGGGRRSGGPGGGSMVIVQSDGGGERRGVGGERTTFRMGGGGRGGAMQPGQGRFHINVYHTWRLQDEVLIADGLPVLDLLDGDATSSRGGSPRHELQVTGGVFRNGMGAFVFGNWRDTTRIEGGTGPDLTFSDYATVSLNAFIDFNQRTSWVERYPILKGARLNFGIQNVFDSRLEVSSSAGDVPLNYQPDYLDPMGRTFSIQFRKILF